MDKTKWDWVHPKFLVWRYNRWGSKKIFEIENPLELIKELKIIKRDYSPDDNNEVNFKRDFPNLFKFLKEFKKAVKI